MAQFNPKKININEINGGQKWEVGQSPSVNTFNAPIESSLYSQSLATQQPNINDIDGQGNPNVSIEEINGAPRFKFSNLKGKDGKDLSKEVKELQKIQEENKKSIINLYAITSPLYVQKTIEQSYSSRITANGENIFNEQFTPILSVEGATVKSKNLFEISKLSTWGNVINNGDGTITVKSYGAATKETLRILCPSLRAGDTATLSFITTATDRNFINLKPGGTYQGWDNGKSKVVTEELLDSKILFYTNSSSDTEAIISNIQIELGTATTEYQPYFTGLKNASFKGIKSTGRNLFDAEYYAQNYQSKGKTGVVFQNGKTYTISCVCNEVSYSTWLCAVSEDKNVANTTFTKGRLVFTALGKISATFTIPEDGKVYNLGFCRSGAPSTEQWTGFFNGSYCSEIMVANGDNTDYEPYTEDTLELPEAIDCGLGTTIDFENQKIVENGVTIVLNGTNDGLYTNVYQYNGLNGVSFSLILDEKESRVDNAICTDATPTKNIGINVKPNDMWIGVNDAGIYWLGILDVLGYTNNWADKSNPTTEEKKQAISDFKGYLAQRYADGNPVTIRYVSSTVQSETPFTDAQKSVGNTYKAWNNGTETVEQGEADNSVYGALNKIAQTYFAPLGEETYE